MADWQPIETAPKDGTEIDLWVKAPPTQLSGGSYGRVPDCWFAFDEWRTWDVFEGETVTVNNVTHWMPRPEPPNGEA
jgi:hypothetical protein